MAAPSGAAIRHVAPAQTPLSGCSPSVIGNADVESSAKGRHVSRREMSLSGSALSSPHVAATCHSLKRPGRTRRDPPSPLPSSSPLSSSRTPSLSSSSRNGLLPRSFSNRRQRKSTRARAQASDGEGNAEKAGVESRPKGIFSFVTDNPSSKSAIQLTATPAQDGNLGQMITQIEGKGRDFGRYVRAGAHRWFVRETGKGNAASQQPPVVLLHGVPTQSYSFRVVMKQLSDNHGYHCFAPDWIGFGFTEKPQPKYDFAYTEDAYHASLEELFQALEIKEKLLLVVQGYVLGQYALTWALKNPNRIVKLAILNTPLTPSASLPAPLQQLRLPFIGEFASQNAVLPERFVEGSSRYVLDIEDADVYRLPYLDSSDAGFAMLEVMRKAPLKELENRIKDGFAERRWEVPTAVIWGEDDKYLSQSEASTFASWNSKMVTTSILSGAGHLPQEDWPEKVVEALVKLFGK